MAYLKTSPETNGVWRWATLHHDGTAAAQLLLIAMVVELVAKDEGETHF